MYNCNLLHRILKYFDRENDKKKKFLIVQKYYLLFIINL